MIMATIRFTIIDKGGNESYIVVSNITPMEIVLKAKKYKNVFPYTETVIAKINGEEIYRI